MALPAPSGPISKGASPVDAETLILELDRLYAAAEDDEALQALPDVVAAACGGRSAMVFYEGVADSPSVQLVNYWPDEDCARYFTEFTERDPWTEAHLRHAGWDGTPVAVDSILPPEQYMQTTIYNELIAPLGDDTARCLGLVLRQGSVRFQIGVHRAAGDRPYGKAELAALAATRDHLTRVLRLRQLLDEERGAKRQVEAMVEASGRAILMVNAQLRIIRTTAAAIAILDEADGLACRLGHLTMWDAAALSELRKMVHATVADRPAKKSALLCHRRSGRAAYHIRVLSAGRRIASHALVVIDDPMKDRTSGVRAYASVYGLTPAECTIAEGLLAGQTLEDIAARRRVTRETVRTQLKSLLARTGVKRQSDLLRLFATLP